MPRDGSQAYTLPVNSFTDPVAATVISPTDAEEAWDDLETAISESVEGPASATSNGIPTFDGTTGRLIKNNSSVTIPSTGLLSLTNTDNAQLLAQAGTVTLKNATASGGLVLGANNQTVCTLSGTLTATFVSSIRGTALHAGTAGSAQGTVTLNGATSGTVTLGVQAAAGTYNWNFPTTAGSANNVLLSGGGGATAMSWSTGVTISAGADPQMSLSGSSFCAVNLLGATAAMQLLASAGSCSFKTTTANAFEIGANNTTAVTFSTAQHATFAAQINLKSFTVATVPSAATAGGFIYVSNESGGAVPAFSDGANWRRVTDRAVVS